MQQKTPPPLPAQSGSKRSRLRSCLIGCGALAGIVVVAVIIGVIWLMLPCKRTVEMTTLVGSNTVAVVHLTDCSDDEGMAEFLGKMVALQEKAQLEAVRQAGSVGAGKFMEMVIRMRGRRSVDPGDVPEALLAVESLEPTSNSVVMVGVGLDSIPRSTTVPIRFMLRAAREGGVGQDHRGVEVADVEGDAQFALTKGVLLFSTKMTSMRTAIDRICDGQPGAPILEQAPAGFADRWDVYAVGDNRDGGLQRLLEEGDDEEGPSERRMVPDRLPLPWKDALSMRAGVDAVDADRLEGEWTISCRNERGADYWRSAGELLLKRAVHELDLESGNVKIAGRVAGLDAIVTVTVSDLDGLLDGVVRRMMDRVSDREEVEEDVPLIPISDDLSTETSP